jgi:hypothetical protein
MDMRWFMLVASLAGTVLGWFLKSYTEEKGKNLATKEDIAPITRIAEEVKAEFERDRANRRAEHELRMQAFELKHQLRVAALADRLRVHQEAYKQWWDLVSAIGDDQKIGPAVMACQEWWVKNNLYLAPEARQAFALAYHQAHLSHQLSSQGWVGARGDTQTMKQVFEDIMKVGPALIQATSLPSLGDQEPLPDVPRKQSA